MTTVTVDDRKRVRIPDAKPGQVLSVEAKPDGGWTLLPVASERIPTLELELVQKGDDLGFELPEGIEPEALGEAIGQAIHEERDSRA